MKIYFVGSPENVKGIDDFYKLSKDVSAEFYWFCWKVDTEVKEKYPNLKFITGLDTPSLKEKIKEMDIFVSFSRFEGFCLPIAEALINLKPVIAYKLPELEDVYKNHVFFVELHAYDIILNKVKNCMENYSFYKINSEISKKFILDNYSPENVTKKLLKILNNGK